MKIAVIIPTLNEVDRIGNTIRYIRENGNGKVRQLIVSDGGSDDHTQREAESLGAKVVCSDKKGRGNQLHFGALHSDDDIEVLYFVHADTFPPKDFVEEIGNAMYVGVRLGTFPYQFDSPNKLLRLNAYCTRFNWFFTLGGDRSLFVRRPDYFKIGGYRPEYVIMEDYDFLKRARKRGYRVHIVQKPCTVSARKYRKNSWLRVQLANLFTYQLWARGILEPKKLRSLYWKMLRD